MSNQAFRFTDKAIKNIKPTAKREYYHDTVEKDCKLHLMEQRHFTYTKEWTDNL